MKLIRFLFAFMLFTSSLYVGSSSFSYKGHDLPRPCDLFYYPNVCYSEIITSCYDCYEYNRTNEANKELAKECAVVFDHEVLETLEKYPRNKWNCSLHQPHDNEYTFQSTNDITYPGKLYHACRGASCLKKGWEVYLSHANNNWCGIGHCFSYKDLVVCDTRQYCNEEL